MSGHRTAAQSREMFKRIQATKANNEMRRQHEDEHRRTDPLEVAKSVLQRMGYAVFACSVVKPGDKRYAVGRLRLTVEEVIEYAAKVTGKADR